MFFYITLHGCDLYPAGSVPDSMSSSGDSQHAHQTISSAVPGGYYVKLQDRIVPSSASSLCDLAVKAADPLACLLDGSLVQRRYDNADYVHAVTADALAAGPFLDYLAQKDCPKAQSLLSFWRDAQVHDSGKRWGRGSGEAIFTHGGRAVLR